MNKNEFYEALNRNREYALEHHGIKGQKWGLRRFQNPDGTLTPAGRARYLKALSDYQKAAGSRDRSVVGSAVKSGLLGGAAGFGITAFEGGTTDQATVSAALSGGASAILGASVAGIKNKIKDAKLNKAVAIMQQFKAMYGDKSVDEITRDKKGNLLIEKLPYDFSDMADTHLDRASSDKLYNEAKSKKVTFERDAAPGGEIPVSKLAKASYEKYTSGKLDNDLTKALVDSHYEDYKLMSGNESLTKEQFVKNVVPSLSRRAYISNDGYMDVSYYHTGDNDPLRGHSMSVEYDPETKTHRNGGMNG